MAANLEQLARLSHPLVTAPSEPLRRIAVQEGLHGLDEADLVIEAITEDLHAKRRLLQEVERLVSAETLMVTNTSSLDMTELSQGLDQPKRFVGMHFFNPPALLPLVEVFGGSDTSNRSVRRAMDFLRTIGKEPVWIRHPISGLIANRLQFVLLWEAIRLCEMGVASPEDIDRVVQYGFGRRLAVVGPFANADLGGLDTYRRIFNYLAPSMPWSGCPRTLDDLTSNGHRGASSGKGFLEWRPEDARRAMERRDQTLVWLLEQQRKGEAADEEV
jgi:3-hydroxybutyryl-CoA dehydrogenase